MTRGRKRVLRRKARGARGLSTGLYVAGVSILGSGLVAAGIVAAAFSGAAGIGIAAVIGAAALGAGGYALWESRRAATRASALGSALKEQEILSLAKRSGGVLTVTEVATALTIPAKDAESLLDSMVDETRVSMRVTNEGGIEYDFLEVAPDTPRVRVEVAHEEAGVGEEVLSDPAEIMRQARDNH